MESLFNPKVKPFLIIGIFWLALFLFVVAGYSGSFGPTAITGFAVNENIPESGVKLIGIQAIAIIVLFFTNIVSMFFLVREIAKK